MLQKVQAPNRIRDVIQLNYELPSGQELRLELSAKKLLNRGLYDKTRALHEIYTRDYLFVPKQGGQVLTYLNDHYAPGKVAEEAARRQLLEVEVFGYIGVILDRQSFDCSVEQLVEFCQGVIDEENDALERDLSDATLDLMLSSANARTHLTKLIVQFASEFLSEGSGMSSYVGGSFGSIQSAIFEIIIDEMGGGVFEKKHSRLYEGTMSSIGLSSDANDFRDVYDLSTYTVNNFVYLLSQNKRYFFRFIGSLFRNEACFVNFQKQFGEALRQVFGSSIDRRYFDVHAVVDQAHSRWSLDNIIRRAVEGFGPEVIPEIVRGFIEYKIYQDLNEIELRHGIETFDALAAVQTQPHALEELPCIFHGGRAPSRIADRFMTGPWSWWLRAVATLTINHDMSKRVLDEGGRFIVARLLFRLGRGGGQPRATAQVREIEF